MLVTGSETLRMVPFVSENRRLNLERSQTKDIVLSRQGHLPDVIFFGNRPKTWFLRTIIALLRGQQIIQTLLRRPRLFLLCWTGGREGMIDTSS